MVIRLYQGVGCLVTILVVLIGYAFLLASVKIECGVFKQVRPAGRQTESVLVAICLAAAVGCAVHLADHAYTDPY